MAGRGRNSPFGLFRSCCQDAKEIEDRVHCVLVDGKRRTRRDLLWPRFSSLDGKRRRARLDLAFNELLAF